MQLEAAPPRVPPEFWDHPPLAEALAAQHMGQVLRAYRRHPWHGGQGIPQPVVGGWLGLAQTQVSRLETGRARKHLDWLTFVARTLRIPRERLWFAMDDDPGTPGEVVAPRVAPRVPNELLRGARLARVSPSGSGRALSRQELADALNAWVYTQHGRDIGLTERSIGKLERGDTRWPSVLVRDALRAVLGVASDAELGLFRIRDYMAPLPAGDATGAQPSQAGQPAAPGLVQVGPDGAVFDVDGRQARDGWPAVQVVVAAGAMASITVADGGTGGPLIRLLVSGTDALTGHAAEVDGPDGGRVYSMAAWRGRR
ncbi:hypothetical protein [Dactylosporangium sp. CA-092794]|uniref:hypothetical protein n=1 Tax=Dactylosporangium sp. CA-092794 TaxID=3239929 RepID=UPI003D92DEF2